MRSFTNNESRKASRFDRMEARKAKRMNRPRPTPKGGKNGIKVRPPKANARSMAATKLLGTNMP